MTKIPIIDITDMYHPGQDLGDNFDILTPYCLPEIDLRAVILDTTERFRRPFYDHPQWGRMLGPRDPGFIPMLQLNYLFDRNVPHAPGPFLSMRSPDDTMPDLPRFQQLGVELMLKTLRESAVPVEVLCFGSLRSLAVAWNREPNLLREKISRVHVSAGSESPDFLEWNVELDPHAMVCILNSGLPIGLYPCAGPGGPSDYARHNTYWLLQDMQFFRRMDAKLRRYLLFAFEKMERVDFLQALDNDFPSETLDRVCAYQHNVWETAIWIQAAQRRLVRRADGTHRIIPKDEVTAGDVVFPERMDPCKANVREGGLFAFTYTDEPTNFTIYERDDPLGNERALREALPALYETYRTE